MPARIGSVIGNEKRGRPSIGVLDSGNHRLEVGETAGDDDGLFGAVDARDLRIQHPDDVQLEGCLHKLLSAKQISWAPRHVLLTKDALFFMLEAGGEIRDTIKLVDIASCSETESTHHANFLKDGDCAEKVNGKMSAMASAASFVGSSFKKTPSPSPKESKTKLTLAMELDRVLEIHTERYGRIYYLRAESVQNRNEWLHAINTAIEAAREKKKIENSLTPRRMWKLRLRRAVNSAPAQNMISLLLVVNFVINVYDSETNYPKGSSQRNFLDNVDNAFTVLYLLELLINMYVHWFRSFFTNGWFVFDFVVVMFNSIESLVLWMAQDDSGGLAVIRMVRIFRIVRLFNKLKSLQKVILGISSTLLPMSNIVIVFGIINSVYAILATRLFLDSYPQKFGSFVASSFTMFQVATGDSWVTDIVFTLNRNDEQSTTVVLLFFSSYVVIVGIILFNIIVAVLLEGFLGAIQKQERDEAAKEEKEAMQRVAGALDPLLATLAQFQSPQHLNAEIQMLFQLLDIDDSGSLTFSEVQIGLEDLPLTPQILLTKEDWWTLTADVVTLGDDEGMSLEAFTTAIRWQLMLYGQRMVGQHMKQAIKKRSEESVTLFALKLCLMQICSQPQCDDKDKESKDVLELELDANPKKSPHSKANGETDTLAVIAEGEHASTQCLHAKLDQILREVHQSSERSKAAASAADAAVLAADEARNTSRAILEYLEGQDTSKDQFALRTQLSGRKFGSPSSRSQPRGPGAGNQGQSAPLHFDASRDDLAIGDVTGLQIEVQGLPSPLCSALIRPSPPGLRSGVPLVNSDNLRGKALGSSLPLLDEES